MSDSSALVFEFDAVGLLPSCAICGMPDRAVWDRIIFFREKSTKVISEELGVGLATVTNHRRHHIPTSLYLAKSVRREAEDLQLFRLLSTNIIRLNRMLEATEDELIDAEGIQHYDKDRVESLVHASETMRRTIETSGMMIAMVEAAKRRDATMPTEDEAMAEVRGVLVSQVAPHFAEDFVEVMMEAGMERAEAVQYSSLAAYPMLGKIAERLLGPEGKTV